MTSFKNTIISSIRREAFNREHYEETIAIWSMYGWLTPVEIVEVMQVLDEVFPVVEE